jgi:hypothetical protein
MLYRVFNSIANRIWKNYSLKNVRTTANDFITFRLKWRLSCKWYLKIVSRCLGAKHYSSAMTPLLCLRQDPSLDSPSRFVIPIMVQKGVELGC